MSAAGVDYSSGHPGGAALKAAGITFAARYVSHTASKNISLAEATDLAAHGVATVVVWETTANRALGGRTAGLTDVYDAVAQATAAGMPADRPIYFAVDFGPTAAQMPAVLAYLDGAASVLGPARIGVYGGYATVKAALDGGHAAWAWQTAAWSGGQWDLRAVLRQFASTVTIHGVSCDLNTATAADYGQWTPGQSPLEDDVPLTAADIELLLDTPIDDPTTSDNSKTTIRGMLWTAGRDAGHAAAWAEQALAVAQKQTVPALTDAQVAAIAAQLAASPALAANVAKAVVDLEAARLKS